MDRSNFLEDYFNTVNYIEQLNIQCDDHNFIDKLQVLAEYQVITQRKIMYGLMHNEEKKWHTCDEKDKNSQNICIARIHNGGQCSRKCKNDNVEFCGSHLHSLPYGRVDEEPQNLNKLVEKKTRGRKSKNKSNVELSQIDLANYIKTQSIFIDETEYLIDENGIVYENDHTNTIVAIKIGETEYQWF
jgi:hypothetical protein